MSHSKQSNLLLCKKCKYKKEREEDNMSSSEVAQLRSRIAAEIQAMNRALYGYAEVARHQIIDQKYCQLGIYQDQLTKILGQREAIEVMIEEFNAYAKNPPPSPSS
jgi:hypothetical protein